MIFVFDDLPPLKQPSFGLFWEQQLKSDLLYYALMYEDFSRLASVITKSMLSAPNEILVYC